MKNYLKDYLLSNSKVVIPSKNIGVVATGSYVPETTIGNEDFINCKPPPQFDEIFGILERRYANGQAGAQMAVKAAQKALMDYDIPPEEIDLILVTGSHKDPEYLTPPPAAYVQTNIGAVNATAFSIDCGFNGFLPMMTTALAYIDSGHYDTVLIVAGESLLDNANFDDFKSMVIGDGAGALILREVGEGGTTAYHHMSAQKDKAASIRIKAGNGQIGGRRYQIKPYLFVEPVSLDRDIPFLQNYIPASILEILEYTDTDINTINKFIFGQQLRALTQNWMANLNLDMDKNFDTLKRYAAVKTASIPINLDKAHHQGIIKKGDIIALGDQGANWYISSMLMQWSI